MRPIARLISFVALLFLAAAAPIGLLPDEAHAQIGPGTFASNPVFNASGTAFAVFGGGSIAQLEASAGAAQATGVWAQDPKGSYQLLVVNGPAFLRAPVLAAFPTGFSGPTAVTLVRPTTGAVPPSTPPASTPTPAPPPPATATYGQTVAQIALLKTNDQRVANGLPVLVMNSQLTAAAEAYAQVVFQQDPYLSNIAAVHTLDADVGVRVTRTGYRWAGLGENAASASGSVQPDATTVATSEVDGWMKSPPHRANIVAPEYTETGVGCATGRPASVRANLDFVVVCIAVYGTPR